MNAFFIPCISPFLLTQLLLMLQVNNIYRTTDWFVPNVADSATPGTKGLQIAGVSAYGIC